MTLPPTTPDDPLLRAPAQASPEAEAETDAAEDRCPRCGTPHTPHQEYCLECGLRLPVESGVVPSLGAAWRRRFSWYPGDWIWPVLLGLVIAALAATVAILASRDHHKSTATTFIATTAQPPTTPSTQSAPTTAPSTAPNTTAPATTSTVPRTSPPRTTPRPPANALTTWPARKSAYTIVLASLPASGGLKAAQAKAREALHAGLRQVGVIDSSKHSSLHPGYYVVFTGIYGSNAQAQAAVARAHARYASAYVRQIVT